jgi:hypothetical protein
MRGQKQLEARNPKFETNPNAEKAENSQSLGAMKRVSASGSSGTNGQKT